MVAFKRGGEDLLKMENVNSFRLRYDVKLFHSSYKMQDVRARVTRMFLLYLQK